MRLTIARFRPNYEHADKFTCYQILIHDEGEPTFKLDFYNTWRTFQFVRLIVSSCIHIMWRIPADWLKISGFLTPLGFDIGEFLEVGGDIK